VTSFDGLPVRYEARGAGSPALVFVHGWACNRTHWQAQMDAFQEDHRVVAVDLGGHGESGKDRARWSVDGLSRDLTAVLEELDLHDVLLVGHSMGGPVSLLAAARSPERVIGVIGADTLHDAERVLSAEQLSPYIAALEADFEGACKTTVQSAFPAQRKVDSRLLRRIEADMLSAGPEVVIGLMRSFIELDARKLLADCPVPVRCINSAAPNVTKVEINRKYAPGFEVVLIDDVSHFLMLEKPVEFNQRLRRLIADW
jgi:pimeloyl-ACP methyl ester carboxylesterase